MSTYRNLHHALPYLLRATLESPIVPSRSGATRERLHVTTTLMRPRERIQLYPGRKANPFAAIAETLWVLAGRSDVEWLLFYLPRALDFSDDGKVWRGGYGPRLRRWVGSGPTGPNYETDQVESVVRELRAHPQSRRAVISLWDPDEDYVDSKDIPCNNWLSFTLRNGKLHLAVAARSNDAWWGWSGINVFEWSVLQECVAFWLSAEVGQLTTFASSFHLYQSYWDAAQKVAEDEVHALRNPYSFEDVTAPRFSTPFSRFDAALDNVFRVEKQMRQSYGPGPRPLSIDIDSIEDPFLHICAQMLAIYHGIKAKVPRRALEEWIAEIPKSDFQQAAQLYIEQQVTHTPGRSETRRRAGGPYPNAG